MKTCWIHFIIIKNDGRKFERNYEIDLHCYAEYNTKRQAGQIISIFTSE